MVPRPNGQMPASARKMVLLPLPEGPVMSRRSPGAMAKLENFASRFGPAFYGLAENRGSVTIEKSPWDVPASYPFGAETVVPLRAGERLAWRFAG